jgi:hypothetical protein
MTSKVKVFRLLFGVQVFYPPSFAVLYLDADHNRIRRLMKRMISWKLLIRAKHQAEFSVPTSTQQKKRLNVVCYLMISFFLFEIS